MPLDAPNLTSSPSPNPQLVSVTSSDAYERGFNDFQFFSYLALPNICSYKWPDEFIIIWILLVKAVREKNPQEAQRVIRFALGLPRGFAKTTFIKLLVCWFVVYDLVNFVLVVCSTEPLAENFLADVSDMMSQPNMVAVYGNWEGTLAINNAKLKKGMYRRRTVVLAAIGSGTSVRGLNIAHERPDFILCDDMQTRENAESDTESLHLLNWFVGTLLKCVSPEFAVVGYLGNMYPQNCILYKLKENPYWTTLITGCILSDGRSLWEELHPLKALYESFKNDEAFGLAHIWFAEMMNDPILERLVLLPKGKLPTPLERPEDIQPEAGFLIVDPAGFKSSADDNVILGVHIMNGKPYARGMRVGKFTPKEVIENSVQLADDLGVRVIFVESTAYQQTLLFWFTEELKRLGLQEHYIIKELSPKNKNKDSRIRVFIQELLSETVYIVEHDTRHKFVYQALSYKLGKKKNVDDVLDAHAYISDVRNDPDNWSAVHSITLGRMEVQHAKVVGNNTPF